MSLASSCGTIPPVQSNYSPKGEITNIAGIEVYCAVPDSFAEAQTKNAIIICYDIFGFHENVKQICDLLASQGFFVAMPDYFRGNPWKIDAGINRNKLIEWLNATAPPETVYQLTTQVVEHLRNEHKVQNFGYAGFCWGGMIASKQSKDPNFDACILIHPGMLKLDDFKESQCPIAFLPSRDEPDLENEFFKNPVLTSKPFGSKLIHRRFDASHGFAGAKGNFEDPVNAKYVNEVIDISVKFFNENLGVKY
ncbi:1796_t:CDS:2 [Scutellospora calospora]|uniref:1796_t:CDS:1 n=1 Tax=Scutellospora calospora TaxID=85575 RepID=A0ACA9JUJ7_9GLOM|nr:1796_t:CDS:2 [Scutellospora calospora]